MNFADRVIIIGAGLAGLCCALSLSKQNVPFIILEASDAVGGRVKTDIVDGFRLDRGFQILLTAYPEAAKILDYDALDLRPFFPGARIRANGGFQHLSDPFREPFQAFQTLLSPLGTLSDKLRVAGLRSELLFNSKDRAKQLQAQSTMANLRGHGFSEGMIQNFFRPFLGGIFLESNLETNAAMFDFVFSMLAKGDNVIPARGMQAIPEQIAGRLPEGSVKLNCPVARVTGNEVLLASGELLKGKVVVLATEKPQTDQLLGRRSRSGCRSQTCVYFTANNAPFNEPILVLNGENRGIVSNLVVPTNVAPTYSSDGRALISAVIIGEAPMSDFVLEESVRNQMTEWFGSRVLQWKHLKTYRIKYALPDQSPDYRKNSRQEYQLGESVYCCGDYMENGSINGAMLSGRKAAEAALAGLPANLGAR